MRDQIEDKDVSSDLYDTLDSEVATVLDNTAGEMRKTTAKPSNHALVKEILNR